MAKIRRVEHGRGHYYIDDNDVRVPGVTTILGDGLAKPALINWAGNTTAEYAVDHWELLAPLKPSERLNRLKKARFEDRDAAGKRGTQVHRLAEKLIHGDEIDVPDELAGHVESYVKFLDEWDVQPVVVEGVVLSERHHWAGTFDLIADFPALNERLICDVKTARSGVFPDNALQLSAYRHADLYVSEGTEHPMPKVDGAAVIHVRADGYSLVPVQAGPAEYRVFRYCYELWRWANEHSQTVVGDMLTPPHLEKVTS